MKPSCIALLCCRREEPNSSHYTDRKSTISEFYDKKNKKCKPWRILDKICLHALIQNRMQKLLPTWGNIWIEKQKVLLMQPKNRIGQQDWNVGDPMKLKVNGQADRAGLLK